jgi:hypothetical protein
VRLCDVSTNKKARDDHVVLTISGGNVDMRGSVEPGRLLYPRFADFTITSANRELPECEWWFATETGMTLNCIAGVHCRRRIGNQTEYIVAIKVFSTTRPPPSKSQVPSARLICMYAMYHSHQPCGASTNSSTSLVSVSALLSGRPALGVMGCCNRTSFI